MHAHSACLVSQSVSLLWSIQVRYDFSITSATSRFAWAQHSDYEIYLMPLMLRVTASAAPASFCQKQTYSPAQQLEQSTAFSSYNKLLCYSADIWDFSPLYIITIFCIQHFECYRGHHLHFVGAAIFSFSDIMHINQKFVC